MKKFITFVCALASLLCLHAQDYGTPRGYVWQPFSDGTQMAKEIAKGDPINYYDNNGPERNMMGNTGLTMLWLKPVNKNCHIEILFNKVNLGEFDKMKIYNGKVDLNSDRDEDTGDYYWSFPSDTPIFETLGNPSKVPFVVRSTAADGGLSVAFLNNSEEKGWEAIIYCIPNGEQLPEPTPGQAQEQPVGTMTFASIDSAVTIGIGGVKGTNFSIDWGDNNKVEYEGAKYIKETPKAKTIKFYGKGILILSANKQGVESVDLSNMTDLSKILLSDNYLTSIDVTHCTNLAGLYVSNNKISSPLDLSRCRFLRAFDCSGNMIPGELNCSDMPKLTQISCGYNKLTSLLLPESSEVLTAINCANNLVSGLNVGGLSNLVELRAGQNKLTNIDLSHNTKLVKVSVNENLLSQMDLTKNVLLEEVKADNNQLSQIDLSKCPKIESLYLFHNNFTSLDLSQNTKIAYLNVDNNRLSTLDLSNQPNLRLIYANHNELGSINLMHNENLQTVKIGNNRLTTVDLSNNMKLIWLVCDSNQLTSLDLTANTALSWLEFQNNQIATIDLSHAGNLQKLFASHNQLKAVDISKNKNLQAIFLDYNQLTNKAIANVLENLPNVSNVAINDNNREWAKQLRLGNNPGGAKSSAIERAKSLGWQVDEVHGPQALVNLVQTNVIGFDASTKSLRLPNDAKAETLVVYNLHGMIVARSSDLSNLASGVYLVRVMTMSGTTLVNKIRI